VIHLKFICVFHDLLYYNWPVHFIKNATLNTETTNNKENIYEFNFEGTKNKEIFDFKFKMSFEQETFSVTKTGDGKLPVFGQIKLIILVKS
jgi:hypothetical protein